MCKIGSPLLSFLLCSLCTPLQLKIQKIKREEENLKQVIEQELGTSIKDILKESIDTACSEKIVIISNLQKEKENEIPWDLNVDCGMI